MNDCSAEQMPVSVSSSYEIDSIFLECKENRSSFSRRSYFFKIEY